MKMKKFFLFMVIVIVFTGIGIYAESKITADKVEYSNGISVKDKIDDLYTNISNKILADIQMPSNSDYGAAEESYSHTFTMEVGKYYVCGLVHRGVGNDYTVQNALIITPKGFDLTIGNEYTRHTIILKPTSTNVVISRTGNVTGTGLFCKKITSTTNNLDNLTFSNFNVISGSSSNVTISTKKDSYYLCGGVCKGSEACYPSNISYDSGNVIFKAENSFGDSKYSGFVTIFKANSTSYNFNFVTPNDYSIGCSRISY